MAEAAHDFDHGLGHQHEFKAQNAGKMGHSGQSAIRACLKSRDVGLGHPHLFRHLALRQILAHTLVTEKLGYVTNARLAPMASVDLAQGGADTARLISFCVFYR